MVSTATGDAPLLRVFSTLDISARRDDIRLALGQRFDRASWVTHPSASAKGAGLNETLTRTSLRFRARTPWLQSGERFVEVHTNNRLQSSGELVILIVMLKGSALLTRAGSIAL